MSIGFDTESDSNNTLHPLISLLRLRGRNRLQRRYICGEICMLTSLTYREAKVGGNDLTGLLIFLFQRMALYD